MTWLKGVRNLCLCGNGEVLAHPQYADILSTIRKMAPETRILIYTNGRAMFGRNLDVTMKHADFLHISQNAIREKSYNAVIHDGNYTLAMDNLRRVSEANWRHIPVKLSFVMLRETLGDIVPAIRLAARYGFRIVRLLYPRKPMTFFDYTLEDSSFDISEHLDIELYRKAARDEGIMLEYTPPDRSSPGVCSDPFTNIQINIDEHGKIGIDYCCKGSTRMVAVEHVLADLENLWNNERITFIRKTVNDSELFQTNRMCFLCRMIDRRFSVEQKLDFFRKFNILLDGNNNPICFDEIVLG